MEIKRSLLLSALTLALAVSGNPASIVRASEESLKLKTAIDRPLLHESRGESKVVIKIAVEGCRAPQKERIPLNLAIVLDRSGSMSGGKLEQAKQAAALLVDQLDRDDVLSLVVYESGVEVVRPAARVGDRHREIADIEKLPEVFENELGELESIVARDIIIEIRCPEGVRPLRFLGRPGELKSGTETITFATLSSGQARELYLECLVCAESLKSSIASTTPSPRASKARG